MTTGNLELRIGDERLYAFTEFEGHTIYGALPALAAYRGSDYRAWFERTAAALLLTIGDRLTAPEHRMVIDIDRHHVQYSRAHQARGHLHPEAVEELTGRGYRMRCRKDKAFLTPTSEEEGEWIRHILMAERH